MSTEWAVRVDEPHPSRKEKLGDIITHFGEEKSRRCREFWSGWTPVYREVQPAVYGPWIEAS